MAATRFPAAVPLLVLVVLTMQHQSTGALSINFTSPRLPAGNQGDLLVQEIPSSLLETGITGVLLGAVKSADVNAVCQQGVESAGLSFEISLANSDSGIPHDVKISSVGGCKVAASGESGTEALLIYADGKRSAVVCPNNAASAATSAGCDIYLLDVEPADINRRFLGGNQSQSCDAIGNGGSSQCLDQSSGGGCFPGDATVQIASGELKQMAELELGDKVAVRKVDGSIAYEDIYVLGHKDALAMSEFIKITIAQGELTKFDPQKSRSLELTSRHFAPISSGIGEHDFVYKRAEDIRVGDIMWALPKYTNVHDLGDQASLVSYIVTGITITMKQGLFNPLTMSGMIIVNGVTTSVHSDWFLDGIFDSLGFTHLLPIVYQALLAPPRMLYKIVGKQIYITVYTWLDLHINLVPSVTNYCKGATSISIACVIVTPISFSYYYLSRKGDWRL